MLVCWWLVYASFLLEFAEFKHKRLVFCERECAPLGAGRIF